MTGVKGFDELIQGGLPVGACVVLEGPSGVEKDYFVASFLAEGLSKGEAVLVVLSSKPPSTFFEELRARGFDPDKLFNDGLLRVVDWYSQREESIVEVEEAGPVIKVSLDLLNVGIAITRAVASLAKDKPKRAVVEILSPALSVYDVSQVHTFAQATKAKLSRQNLTSIFLVEKEMHDSTTLSTLLQPFDGVIDMDRSREGDKIVRKLAVLSLKGTAAQSTYVPFEITGEGSLTVGSAAPAGTPAREKKPSPDRPRDAALWFSLGKALLQSGRVEKAIVALESCVKIDPQNAEALSLVADALEKLGRADEAEKTRLSVASIRSAAAQGAGEAAKAPRVPSRIMRILEGSETRLAENPKDPDALFAKATALAALERHGDSMRALNDLTKIDHRYPGLWLLKAKIYTTLGDDQKAKLCQERAQQIEKEVAEAEMAVPEGSQPTCPLCETPVQEGADRCSSCGAQFEIEPTEVPEAAPQIKADRKPAAPPSRRPPEESRIAPAPSELKKPSKGAVVSAPKGRTNGLTNGLGRTNGLTNGLRGRTNGLTNGLKGRTNGLTKGQRGKTNGLTNGMRGRTNGLTNGLRGRTNGLTNGLRGRTNGLTNGLRGRTNGLTNGLKGRTNGLVNGIGQRTGKVNGLATHAAGAGVTNGIVNGIRSLRSGITNGLTNGNGFTNGLGSGRFKRQTKVNRWKLYAVPIITVLLLMVPLMFPSSTRTTSPYKIQIDGDFSDWTNQRVIAMQPDPGPNPNVKITRAGVADNLDFLSFYVEVEGSLLQGGPQPQKLMDSVRVFMDIDRKSSTGYLVKGMGAEYMVEVWGWGGVPYVAKLWHYAPVPGNDQHNWSSWGESLAVEAAMSSGRLETEVPWLAMNEQYSVPIAARFQVRSWDGEEQFSEHIVGNRPGVLQVSQRSLASATLSGSNVPLLVIEVSSIEGSFVLDEIHVNIIGTVSLNDLASIRLMDNTLTVLDSRMPLSRSVNFHPSPPIQLASGDIVTMTVEADITGSGGSTLGVSLTEDDAVVTAAGSDQPGAVTLVNMSSNNPLGYLGPVPAGVVIDGGFGEWTNIESDAQGESSTQGKDSLDIASFDTNTNASASFYLKLHGRALEGTATPQPSMPAPNATNPTVADTDKDTVPNTNDTYPFDFNNDGVQDNVTGHDVDGDAILDYPWGTDVWLNTTIPGWFPAPYAGRVVSLYIGPSMRPPVRGEDSARFFVDVDNSTLTGYEVGGIGADYLIEIRGREGRVTSAGVFMFTGATEHRWVWAAMGPASHALVQDRLEASGTIPGLNAASRVLWEMSDWRNSAEDIARSATRGTRGICADGTPLGMAGSVNTYVDETGQVHIAELNLVKTGGRYSYSVEKNGLAAFFAGENDGDGLSLLTRGDLQFSWQPLDFGTIDSGEYVSQSEAARVSASVAGNQIEFAGLFPTMNDRYSVQLDRVKHDLVMTSPAVLPPEGDVLSVRGKVLLSDGAVFAVNGAVQQADFTTAGDIQVISPSGVLMTLRAPYAYEDGNVEARVDGSFRVQKAGSGWILSMELPLSWLLDKKRSYPVFLDPTAIIDTSSNSGATMNHHQRKVFHDGTYFWAFYYDGSHTQYEYSSDGMSWVNTRAQAFTTSGMQYVSVWYYDSGSTKFVYTTGDTGGNQIYVYVRKGTISGTTISWGTEYTVTVSAFGEPSKVPYITRSSDGYIWLSAKAKETSSAFNLAVARSTNTDDVSAWNTYTTMMPSNSATNNVYGSVVPLTGGDVYATWYVYSSGSNGNIQGKKYTSGSGWGSVDSIDTAPGTISYATPSAVVDGSGYINIVYISASGNVLYRQRTSSWGSPTTLDSNSGNTYPTISRETSSGNLYAFWKDSTTQIKSKMYSGGSWSSVTLETNTIAKNFITSIYEVSGSSKISWAWTGFRATGLYNIRFSMISTTVKSVTVDDSTSSSATQYSHQRRLIYDGSYYWAFYDFNGNTVYTYSSDGDTWTYGYTQLYTTSGVISTSVWYYSGASKIVYAVGDDVASDKTVVVRRGTISSTTITWGSEYLVQVSTKNMVSKMAYISRDSSGYLWVASSQQEVDYNFAAVRSSNTDDVSTWWTNYTPLMSADIANTNIHGVIVPLGSQYMYALWYANGAIAGKRYTGSWSAIENINSTSTGVTTKGPSVVVDSSYYVNLVFADTTGRIQYRQRTSSWGTATVVTTTTSNTYPSITLETGSGNLYVFWIDSSSQITGKKYSSGSWSSVTEIDTSTITKNYLTTIYSASASDYVSWLWGQGGSTPYEVKFARIPEFEDILIPVVGIGMFVPILGRWRRARRRDVQNKDVPRQ